MSALETTVRVNSEKQTLILAGEPEPRRFAYNAASLQPPLTLVATPVDDPLLIAQSGREDVGAYAAAVPRNLVPSASFADRGGSAYDAANAYARTQQLFANSRSAIIDTYA